MILYTRERLSFNDVQLLDQYSETVSRSDISLEIDGMVPIILAPMMAIQSIAMENAFAKNNLWYCHHRYTDAYATPIDQDHGMAAIGVSTDKMTVQGLLLLGYKWFNLDVAACYHKNVLDKLVEVGPMIKEAGGKIIVGNFSNEVFMLHLNQLEEEHNMRLVDYVKVSQGGGSVCSTRLATGVGKPTLQAVMDCKELIDEYNLPYKVIADGGIKTSGDMAKAFGAGASMCMVGSIFAAHHQSPSKYTRTRDGVTQHLYFGMASERAKRAHFGHVKNIEGVETWFNNRGDVNHTIANIKQGLQSSIAMQGFKSLEEYIGNASFLKVTTNGSYEATTHAKDLK